MISLSYLDSKGILFLLKGMIGSPPQHGELMIPPLCIVDVLTNYGFPLP